ncbi:MAG: DUF6726 family protein [Desulfamplus sp.]
MKYIKILLILMTICMLSGCLLTKVVTVPMRVGGAVVSIIPGVGDAMHDSIDGSAELVDDLL